jgi:hypothetical protein
MNETTNLVQSYFNERLTQARRKQARAVTDL